MAKNIIVGDIGSTKSAWWTNMGGNREILLSGYNPLTQDDSVGQEMAEQLAEAIDQPSPSGIWYYGAGVVDAVTAAHIRQMLLLHFPSSEIHVDSDLKGACEAACGEEPGTVILLGTGSHAAVYDGRRITRQASSLGYILGDEGGGSDIGKALLQAYFYSSMPDEIAQAMSAMLPEGRTGMLQQLYHSSTPNQYLAEFARIAVDHIGHPWVIDLVRKRFNLFITTHLAPMKQEGKIQIVGSIGYIFAGLIRQELERSGYEPGEWIRHPAKRLFDLHTNDERTA